MLENWQPVLAIVGFCVFWLWESSVPFHEMAKRLRHAARNLTLAGVNGVASVLLLSVLTAAVAEFAALSGLGLLHFLQVPSWAAVGVSLLGLDLWTYLWHCANHRVAVLWRFHRMHHSDENMDVTTATRFHLGEILISTFARLFPVVLLGTPAVGILAYDIVLLCSTQFHHANIGLPEDVDRRLRYAIVTPNMHRVHHSTQRIETDSNYSSGLSAWDRLFRTYRENPDYRTIRFGIAGLTGDRFQTLRGMLETPFQTPEADPER